MIDENQLRMHIRKMLLSEQFKSVSSRDKYSGSKEEAPKDEGKMGDFKGINYKSIPNKAAVKAAKNELSFWANGKRKENKNDEETNQKLNDYWAAAKYKPDGDPWSAPWSAAFISYVMQKAGEREMFNSAAHTTWATKALKNRNAIIDNPKKFIGQTVYVLFGRDEATAEPGDIVFRLRDGGNIKNWISGGGGQTPSHSDVYIGSNQAIGGNLSDSSKQISYKHPVVIKKIKITGAKDQTDKAEGEAAKTGGSGMAPAV